MTNLNHPQFIKKEKIFVFILIVILNLIVILPLIYGWLTTPPGKIFTWITTTNPSDQNAYYAWVNQASQGKVLMEILYTSEKHPALFFHPIFFLIGQIVNFFKLSPEFVFTIFSIIANFLLLVAIYYFISHFISSSRIRKISFALIALGGGLGWLPHFISADSYLLEINILNVMRYPFIMSFGLMFILLALLCFIKSLEENGIKNQILTGILIFLLALIHPYDLIIFYGLAISYLIFFTKFWRKILKIIITFLFPLPIIIYNFLVINSSLVWQQQSHATISLPDILGYFLGLFFFLILLPFSFGEIKRDKKIRIIFVWAVVYFLLIYLPINFQWKFGLGISVPLGILAGIGLNSLAQFLNKKFRSNFFTFIFIFLAIFISSSYNFLIFYGEIFGLQTRLEPFYLSKETVASFNWLKNNVKENEIILSSYETGTFIPRYSGKKVFLGHWAQTIFAEQKSHLVSNFYSQKLTSEKIKKFLKNNNIKYIFYSDFEKRFGLINLENIGKKVFKNSEVKIYKTN